MSGPHVLIVLDTSGAWSRGILKGFCEVAHERGWTLLHYHPSADITWLIREWQPRAAVLYPCHHRRIPAAPESCALVSVNHDLSAGGIASVCLDEESIAELASAHLLSKGLTHLTTFRFTDDQFAVVRERGFCRAARAAGARLVQGYWMDGAHPPRSHEYPAVFAAWIAGLPRPCGVFACCDSWARVVARYCAVTDLRIPDDVALLGVDNDVIECELTSPPISSVAVPWRTMGRKAAWLVERALAGEVIAGQRIVIPPVDVIARRSTDVRAIDDPLVARAVAWICEHADRRLTVPTVARAVSVSRQRLERRFRAALDRTVMQEVRRAHVDLAKRLLSTTRSDLAHIARLSGFTSAPLLSVVFRQETGTTPGAYRRRFQGIHLEDE
jgi:LacI family transcriptional regulator